MDEDKQVGGVERKKRSGNFDWSMHYFRGFAIVCIVLTHLTLEVGRAWLHTALFGASTIFFLFISGYLCKFLDMKKKTNTGVYYKKKFLNVILPYFVCSAITIALVYCTGVPHIKLFNPFAASAGDWIRVFAYGRAQSSYWYIPFVSILFLISPLLLRLSGPVMCVVTMIGFVFSIIFPSRGYPFTISWPNTFYLFTYFFPSYCLGFVYAEYREKIENAYFRFWWVLAALSFMVFSALVFCAVGATPSLGLHMCDAPLARSVEKLLLIGVAIRAFSVIKSKRVALLDAFAEYSFTIYFLHRFFISDAIFVRGWVGDRLGLVNWNSLLGAGVDVVLYSAYIFLMLLLAMVLKTAFGKYSRSFIGS